MNAAIVAAAGQRLSGIHDNRRLARKSEPPGGRVSSMTGSVAVEEKGPQPVTRSVRRRPAAQEAVESGTTRFFLARPGPDGGTPQLDRELATEGEAMIESLKSGLSYYSVVEWRATGDLAGKNPPVKKEEGKKQEKSVGFPGSFTTKLDMLK